MMWPRRGIAMTWIERMETDTAGRRFMGIPRLEKEPALMQHKFMDCHI